LELSRRERYSSVRLALAWKDWKDWPEKWGTDAGIDIVARKRTCQLWAIQAMADHPNRAIPKREIDI
jgi:predicted helicase